MTGFINITSEPSGAMIIIDGQISWKLTPDIVEVTPGIHSILLQHSYDLGYPDFTQTVNVVDGETSYMNAIFLPPTPPPPVATGAISVDSVPSGAKVYVDDQYIGWYTPALMTFITPGSHVVKLTLPDYVDFTQTVTVEAGKSVAIYATLLLVTPLPTGFINITSVPSGAWIYIDGQNMNADTPRLMSGITPGDRIVKLTFPGYLDFIQTVTVVVGETSYMNAILVPISGCIPNWQCEYPLNGYENDGCGNRRLNSACNPPPCVVPSCNFSVT